MKTLSQSPLDPDFVQNPYPFYAAARSKGALHYWQEYGMPGAFKRAAVHALLRDRRFGREIPPEMATEGPAHLAPFLAIEAHSMLEAEPPRHTRLRKLVTRAFTSREIKAQEEAIKALCHSLIDAFPEGEFDLLSTYCQKIPILTICRLMGVPPEMAPQLLTWSHAIVAMYQAGRTHETELAAAKASSDFTTFLSDYIEERRKSPSDDLISRLIVAEEDGDQLNKDELIGTCILLLNAGHEASVHAMGNGVKTLLEQGWKPEWLAAEGIEQLVEEILRFDPPLHMFTRYAYEEAEVMGHTFQRGDQVALLLAAANRDPAAEDEPDRFDPTRPAKTNLSFGGGLHFCVGAPLARMELQIGLPILFQRCPNLRLAAAPQYSNTYHFHGLEQLKVCLE